MQILGITFLRIVGTSSGQRLLIGSENNGFYYSDNEGFTLTETLIGIILIGIGSADLFLGVTQ